MIEKITCVARHRVAINDFVRKHFSAFRSLIKPTSRPTLNHRSINIPIPAFDLVHKMLHAVIIILIIASGANSAPRYFVDHSSLHLLTVSPSQSISQGWGHSAIWLVDSANNIDFVFEYTSTEKATWLGNIRVLLGKDKYQLRATNFEQFEKELSEPDQEISLALISKDTNIIQTIYQNLASEIGSKQVQVYRSSTNNCSTLIAEHLHPYISFLRRPRFEKSIRETFRDHSQLSFFAEVMIVDVLTSGFADFVSPSMLPYTPISLQAALDGRQYRSYSNTFKMQNNLEYLGLVIVILILAVLSKKYTNAVLTTFFIINGLLGILMIVILLSSSDPLFYGNHQVLYLNPLGLLYPIADRKTKQSFCALFTVLIIFSSAWSFFNGHLNPVSLTLMGLFIVVQLRTSTNFFHKQITK
ncbi:MAG: hypothetical protein JXQ90_18345 [Cyclobacteriaceae bacterium]